MVPAAFEVDVTSLDNVSVASVALSIDGSQIDQTTTSPFVFHVQAGLLAAGSHTLVATATDAAGNRASSTPVSVTVEAGGGSGGAGPGSSGGASGGNEAASVTGSCAVAGSANSPSGLLFLLLALGSRRIRRAAKPKDRGTVAARSA
jgi:hypothetical protein